jgi:hypothetical protein
VRAHGTTNCVMRRAAPNKATNEGSTGGQDTALTHAAATRPDAISYENAARLLTAAIEIDTRSAGACGVTAPMRAVCV